MNPDRLTKLKSQGALHMPSTAVLVAIGVIVLLLGVVALVWYLRKRRKAARPDEDATPAAPETQAGDDIALCWRLFVQGLPRRARRSLNDFHPIVVLGPESSGKEAIIERFSGVGQRRAEIGAPASSTEGDLRLHLGADCLVMELSEEACRARMDTVDAGLRKAFGPMLRQRSPLVVVCLSPESLDKRSEQDLRELGGALRAKIDLLAELRGETLEVRVVVPAAAGAGALEALYILTQMPGVSPILPLGRGEEPPLRAQLGAFTDLLSETLVSRSSQDALAVVALLEAVPKLSQALASLAGELLAGGEGAGEKHDSVSDGGLYLVPVSGGPNPLRLPASLLKPQPHPLVRHRLIAVTAAAAATGWVIAGYLRHDSAWQTASGAASVYAVDRRDEEVLRRQIHGYARGRGTSAVVNMLLPPFFDHGPPAVGCAFVERIRKGPLEDELTDEICRSSKKVSPRLAPRCANQANRVGAEPENLLHVLALLYASTGNDLHALVRQSREQWASFILTVPIIDDYLDLAGPNRDVALLEELWSYGFESDDARELGQIAGLLEPLSKAKHGLAHPAALVDRAQAVREVLRDRGRFGHAAEVLDSRSFEQQPLKSYAPVFSRYRTRLELLQELSERRPDLDRVIDAVTGGAAESQDKPPTDVPALVDRLGALLDERHDASTVAFQLGPSVYEVDLAAVSKALRDTRVRALVDAFADNVSDDELTALGFDEHDLHAEVNLRARWPEGVSSVPKLPRTYTRAGFEKSVKPHLVALDKLLARLGDLPAQRGHLVRIVRTAVERYAHDYENAIDDLYGGFKMSAVGAMGMKRVLRALAGGGSPLRDFLDDVAHNSALGLEEAGVALLDPLLEVETKYEPIAKLSDPGKPGGPLVAYQDILREALSRLDHGAPSAAAQSAFGAGLAPLGRLAFDSLSDPKTSPLEAARAWAQAQRLDEELARPFLEPLIRLGEQASGDLGRSLGALNRSLVRMLDTELLSRYPFNPQASEEVDPDELDGWLNPKRGRVVRDILSVVAPLVRRNSQYDGSRAWAPSATCAEDAACSKGLAPLLATVNDLAHLTALLWTEDGKTQPLRLRVLPHPLQASGAGPRPVAVRLVVGEGHVDYFNQKPAETVLELDWTKRQTATLSVDLASKDPVKSFEPPAVVVSGTPWSFLRLLQRGQRAGATRTWQIPAGNSERVNVSLTVREGATEAFRVGAGALRRMGSAEN